MYRLEFDVSVTSFGDANRVVAHSADKVSNFNDAKRLAQLICDAGYHTRIFFESTTTDAKGKVHSVSAFVESFSPERN
jgi:predicted xylose isomerase-like sugar epimerase